MVEYKRDGATGEPVLMEVNGRFWGSLQLAIDAGVDFPSLLLDSAEGRPPPGSPPEWRHVRLRWIWGEVDHLLARLRGGGPGVSPSDHPVHDRLRAVREVLWWSRGDRTEVFRWDDWRPFARESAQRLRWWANRIFRGSST